MKKLIIFCCLIGALVSVSFAQTKPKDGTFVYDFFDDEYNHFHGTCKVIIKGDTITVIAVDCCYRAAGDTVETGLLKYRKDGILKYKSGTIQDKRWIIVEFKDDDPDNYHASIDVKKKIFYDF